MTPERKATLRRHGFQTFAISLLGYVLASNYMTSSLQPYFLVLFSASGGWVMGQMDKMKVLF